MINFEKLHEPFSPHDIEWRVQSSGEKNGKVWARVLAYVTNRAIQERLDNVCGPENWRNEFKESPVGGVLCGLSIRVGDEWVTKWDGAENTQIEAVKGGLSGAMKRAGVQWGIGRYLYNLPEGWAEITESGKHSGKTKDGEWFRWNPPQLPKWALPEIDAMTQKVEIDAKVKKKFIGQVLETLETGDENGLRELWDEWSNEEKAILWGCFNSQQRAIMKSLMGQ